MNETDTSLQLYAVFFVPPVGTRRRNALCSLAVMFTGADRLLRGESTAMSAPPRGSGMKRVSEQRCSAAVH